MPRSYPVIVVPGITATYLRDDYPLPPEHVWKVLEMQKDYDRVALHPDNLRYEAREPARVMPGQLYEIAYRELIEELRHNLRDSEDETVPVYPFGYDWRQPLAVIEAQLADFVEEVIERTKLMRLYHNDGYGSNPKVNLVGHSMGGLVIAGYLQRHGGRRRVHKVSTIATPFQGSFEAVIKMTTGTANLGGPPPSSREREAARMTPALYHLLPSFSEGLTVTPPTTKPDLFNADLWQPSIIDTIAEYIRLRGVHGAAIDHKYEAQKLFGELLHKAAEHRYRVNDLRLDDVGMATKDWLCIVGVNAKTRVRLRVDMESGVPNFVLDSKDRDDKWKSKDQDERRMTGDGTVPFNGALPYFLPYQSLVCVSPDDFGYWELGDIAATKLAGFHGIVPNMNLVHRLIVRHFTGRPDRHGNTWGRVPPGITKRQWDPPLPDLDNK